MRSKKKIWLKLISDFFVDSHLLYIYSHESTRLDASDISYRLLLFPCDQ